jgi:hypothetical protein
MQKWGEQQKYSFEPPPFWHVAGFVSKSEAEKCLQSASKGTFLCRFSDTKLGGVSIVDRRRQNCKYMKRMKFE